MYCNLHSSNEAIGACTSCGKLICRECAVEMQNKLVCRECLSIGRATLSQISVQRKSTKDRSIAIILEVLPGIFGLPGIGWIYSGNTKVGLILLFSMIGWNILVILPTAIMTAGGSLLICCIPATIIVVVVSVMKLTTYTQQHPELFGR
jgi:hypothetical protein